MARLHRRIVISDDEEDENAGNRKASSVEQPLASQPVLNSRIREDPFTPVKREKRKKFRHPPKGQGSEDTLSKNVGALEISPRPSSDKIVPFPTFALPRPSSSHGSLPGSDIPKELDNFDTEFAIPSTPAARAPSLPSQKSTPDNGNYLSRSTESAPPATPVGKQTMNDTFSISTPLVTSTPVQPQVTDEQMTPVQLQMPNEQSTPVQPQIPDEQRVQVAHLESLSNARKSFSDPKENVLLVTPRHKSSLHLPPPSQQPQRDMTQSQYSNEGLVTVSPSKGRLRSLAAEQAITDKDAPSKPRLVISKLVLTNFKSYAGRQEIGPFHSVGDIHLFICPCAN